MIVTLIRHGQTDWNLAGRIQGSTDIPLNDTGREQAREAARALDASVTTVMYSSDLSRANETARIIADVHGWNDPHVIPPLRERFYGEAEGILAAAKAAGVPATEIGRFGGSDVVFGNDRAALKPLSDLYRCAFADGLGLNLN